MQVRRIRYLETKKQVGVKEIINYNVAPSFVVSKKGFLRTINTSRFLVLDCNRDL